MVAVVAPGVSNEGGSHPLLALGSGWNRLGEAVKTRKKTRKNGETMGEIWSKTCEQGKERRDHLGRRRVPCTFAVDLIRGSFFIMTSGT